MPRSSGAHASGPTTYFAEKQHFNQLWLWALVGGMAALFWYGAYRQLVQGESWGTNPAGNLSLFLAWLLAGVALPALFAFGHLRTEVREDGIAVRFVPFHLRRRVWPWDRIEEVRPRQYSPLREFGGWGIRIGPSGWAYNVSGDRGIEVTFRLGHRILIGTQEPEAFMRAVERARRQQ
jgi:hypothetical protein